MKTSEVEIVTGISKQTLYFYEVEGLVEVSRDLNGYRNYSETNIQTLQMIRLLRDLEVSIDDIKSFINGSLSIQSILDIKAKNLDRTIETQKDIQRVVSVLKRRDMPLIMPFEELGRQVDKTLIGYWRTSDKVSIGRRLTKGSLVRTFAMIAVNALVLTLALMIGIPKMIGKPVALWVYGLIFVGIVLCISFFFVSDLLTTGSPVPTSRFKFVEFGREGICYYFPKGLRSNLKYVLNVFKGETDKSLEFSSYDDIERVLIKSVRRYMGGRVAMGVRSVDFEIKLKDTRHFYFVSPLLLDQDSYWLAEIILAKIPNVIDDEGILNLFSKGQNVNESVY